MKYIFLFFSLVLSNISYSQFFVGDTYKDVKDVLKKEHVKFTKGKVTDTTHRISWIEEGVYQMIILFDNHDTVIRQTLIPEREEDINGYVKRFNKNYVPVSDREWKNYANGRIYRIQLEYLYTVPIFSITLVQ